MNYRLSKRMDSLPFSEIRKIMELATQLERNGEKVIHLELGRPDFDTPQVIKDACKKSLDDGNVFYTSSYGIPNLRQAIADKLREENHIPYSPNEILVTVGLSSAIYSVLGALLNEGDEVLVPNPVWLNYIHVIKNFGCVPVTYNLLEDNDYKINIEEIKSKITNKTRVIVIVSPNNPTGGVLSLGELEQLADIVMKNDLIIISDEIYEKIIYDGLIHYSIAALPHMKEHTITLNGFSKAFSMTGWRLGYMAAPEPIIQASVRLHQYMNSCAVSFVQEAAITALKAGKEYVSQMVTEYQRRRDYLFQEINRMNKISCQKPKGAFYIFINTKKINRSSADIARFLLEHSKIALVPGSAFGDAGEGYLRLSFATSYENLVEACDRLVSAITKIP